MPSWRVIVSCMILTVLAAAIQAAPGIMVLGGIPIFIAVRLNLVCGAVSLLAAAYITSRIGLGELLYFMCSGGIIGFSLGILKDRFRNTYIPPIIAALIVFLLLDCIDYYLGINIFGHLPHRTPLQQALLLLPPLYVYSLVYFKLAIFADGVLHKYIELYDR